MGYYSDHYNRVALYHAPLYDGMKALLEELRAAGADVPLGALSDAEAADAIVRWLGN